MTSDTGLIVLEPLTGSNHRTRMWPKPGISRAFGQALLTGAFCRKLPWPLLPRIMPWRASIPLDPRPPMTLTVADTTEHVSPMRGLLPLWVGIFIYGLFVLAGNRLLIDPDTLWQ